MPLSPAVALACRQQLLYPCASASSPSSSAVSLTSLVCKPTCATALPLRANLPCAASTAGIIPCCAAASTVPCSVDVARGSLVSSVDHHSLSTGAAVATVSRKRQAHCRRRALSLRTSSYAEGEEDLSEEELLLWRGRGHLYSDCNRHKKRFCYASDAAFIRQGLPSRCCNNDSLCNLSTVLHEPQTDQSSKQQQLHYQREFDQQQHAQQALRALYEEQHCDSFQSLPSSSSIRNVCGDGRPKGIVGSAVFKQAAELKDEEMGTAAATEDVVWMNAYRKGDTGACFGDTAYPAAFVSEFDQEAAMLLQKQQHRHYGKNVEEQHLYNVKLVGGEYNEQHKQLSPEHQLQQPADHLERQSSTETEDDETRNQDSLGGFRFCWEDRPLPSPSMHACCYCSGTLPSISHSVSEREALLCRSSNSCIDCRKKENSYVRGFSSISETFAASAVHQVSSDSPVAAAPQDVCLQHQQQAVCDMSAAEVPAAHAPQLVNGTSADAAAAEAYYLKNAGTESFSVPAESTCALSSAAALSLTSLSASPSSAAPTSRSALSRGRQQEAPRSRQQKQSLTPLQQKLKAQLQSLLDQQMKLYKQQLLRTELQPRTQYCD